MIYVNFILNRQYNFKSPQNKNDCIKFEKIKINTKDNNDK